MTVWIISGLMVAFAALGGWSWWKARNPVMGEPPLVDPNLVFYFSLIVLVVLATNLIELLTGMEIKSMFGRR